MTLLRAASYLTPALLSVLGACSSESSPTSGPDVGGGSATSTATGNQGGSLGAEDAAHPFPVAAVSPHCQRPASLDHEKVRAAYETWKSTVVSADGAGGFLRVRKPDSGTVIGSTVSEGQGYGLLLAVYFADQALFDALWRYTALYLNDHGLMEWEIDPTGKVIGTGAATDGDEDIAWALLMAHRQWGGSGSLTEPYLTLATRMIDAILTYEVDRTRNSLLLPGDAWGEKDVTNLSYFAPAYFRVFGEVTGKQAEWNAVIDENYAVLERTLSAANGNESNGLVPAWNDSAGTPVVAYSGAPTHFQNDSTRTPFRVGQDWCWFGEPRAQAYLAKIAGFYAAEGVANIVDGYELDGTPRPDRAVGGLQAASFVGPAGVAFSSDAKWNTELEAAWTAVASEELTAGTIYYQKSWTALSLLMMAGDFTVLE